MSEMRREKIACTRGGEFSRSTVLIYLSELEATRFPWRRVARGNRHYHYHPRIHPHPQDPTAQSKYTPTQRPYLYL